MVGQTIVDVMSTQVETHSDHVAFRFFSKDISNPVTLKYADLWIEAAALAQRLRASGLEGKRILLNIADSAYFVISFFACLMAAAIAVPVPPASRKRLADRLQSLVTDVRATAMIGDSDAAIAFSGGYTEMEFFDCRRLIFDRDNVAVAALWCRPNIHGETLAFLQYTSGSTDNPKGVMVSHCNLMANCAAIQAGMEMSAESKVLSALPLFHDMGLVGGVIEAVYVGGEANLLSPVKFVQNPEYWLRLISQLQITISGGPNFMFDLAAREIAPEQMELVDLSSWQIAFCGAEPVRAAVVKQFIERFAPYGFKATSFYPCYGLAEATLFVTGIRAGTLPRYDDGHGYAPIISCGYPRCETQVEIVDPLTGLKIEDHKEGEIWVRGDSIAQGYWGRPDLSREVFCASITGPAEGPFLRTGDLGFRSEGELFITGRLKDVIIVRGKKYAPQDIEQEVEGCHEAIMVGGCAVFAMEQEGSDAVIIVVELHRSWLGKKQKQSTVLQAVRAAVFNSFQLGVKDVVCVYPYAIPRTSSGKLKRSQCRADYLAGCLAYA